MQYSHTLKKLSVMLMAEELTPPYLFCSKIEFELVLVLAVSIKSILKFS